MERIPGICSRVMDYCLFIHIYALSDIWLTHVYVRPASHRSPWVKNLIAPWKKHWHACKKTTKISFLRGFSAALLPFQHGRKETCLRSSFFIPWKVLVPWRKQSGSSYSLLLWGKSWCLSTHPPLAKLFCSGGETGCTCSSKCINL